MSGMENLSRFDRTRLPIHEAFASMFALLALLSLAGCLGSEPGSSPDGEVLRIGTSGDYRPFSSIQDGETTRPGGFSIDLGKAYAAATGRRIEWVPFAWPELTDDLEAGHFDLALSGVTVRADRSIAGRFSLPVTVSGAVLLVRADGPLADHGALVPTDPTAVPALQFAVNAGGHLEWTARKLFPDAEIVPVPDNGSVLDQIDAPATDGVMTDSLEAPHWLARRPDLMAIGPLTRDRKAAWFPIQGEIERTRFDAWLLRAEGDGTLAALRARHGLPPDRTAEPISALLALLDDRLSLMTEVARVKQVMGRPIEDRAREEKVLDAAVGAVRREAAARSVAPPDAASVRDFYQAQIEAAKWIQRTWTHANPGSASAENEAAFAAAQSRLGDEVRPALIDLGDGIARLVVESGAAGEAPLSLGQVEAGLARHELPQASLIAIHAGLARMLRPSP